MQWIRNIEEVEGRFDELSVRMAEPAVIADPKTYQRLAKQHSEIARVVEKYRAWKQAGTEMDATKPLLQEPDPDIVEMAGLEGQAGRGDSRTASPSGSGGREGCSA